MYGFLMELESGKLVDEMIIKTGTWEPWVSEVIKKYLSPWDVFVDIWANIGYDSLLASTIVGESGKVFSFEPSTKNFNRLKRNVALNHFSNIHLFPVGIGDKEEVLRIYYNEFNPWESSLNPWVGTSSEPDEFIKVQTLDSVLEQGRVDFIKMDTEWFEPKAFQGMWKILQKNRKIKIIFEFSPSLYHQETQSQEKISLWMLHQLQDLWFHLYHINNSQSNLLDHKINHPEEYYKFFTQWIYRQADIFCIRDILQIEKY